MVRSGNTYHFPEHIETKSVLWQALINKKQQKKLDVLFEEGEDFHLLIMNVESFSTQKGVDFAYKFLSWHNTLFAIDESTTVKTPSAARTKNVLKIGKLAKYRRIMTGSPVTKNPLDVYSQLEFLSDRYCDRIIGHSDLGMRLCVM